MSKEEARLAYHRSLYNLAIARSPQQHALWLAAMQNMAPLPWPPVVKEVQHAG